MNEMPVVGIRKRSLVSRGLLTLIFLVLCGGMRWVWVFTSVQRQDNFIHTALVLFVAFILFLLWVLFASAWHARMRWSVFGGTVAAVLFCRFTLRISGVTDDLIPSVEWKWKKPPTVSVESTSASAPRSSANEAAPLTNSYPQFLGPNRDGTLPGPLLARGWKKHPPKELWRHPVGAAWSDFAVAGSFALPSMVDWPARTKTRTGFLLPPPGREMRRRSRECRQWRRQTFGISCAKNTEAQIKRCSFICAEFPLQPAPCSAIP